MTTRENRVHEIRDFLSRPIVIASGLWSKNDLREKQLYTANFPESLIANTMYQEKLNGFVGLRATLVIKVQVNSQPFQQGRLMLQYIPYAQYMPNRVDAINLTLQGRSGCPRTDLDLSVGTEIEMKMPYVSPHAYYNLVTGQGSFGSIYLVVYSPLVDTSSGTGNVEYTIWAHLEDVDIQYPTGAYIYTGNLPNKFSLAKKLMDGNVTEKDIRAVYNDKSYNKGADTIFAQMGVELEQLAENKAPSSGVGQIATGLNTLSKIPMIGNIFTKPAWISQTASNVLKHLGYSKPTIVGLPCENKLRTQARMANFDGADASHKMALSSQNEVETVSGLAGTSVDEMALSHVLSIPNYWDNFSWKISDKTTTTLWTNDVTPMKIKPWNSAIKDTFRTTHMGFIANTFGYWRGSIVYTFKFVKTSFHSGRIRIAFIPFWYPSQSYIPDRSRTYQMVVDLRTATEVSFTVPYVSTRPWMQCIRPESTVFGSDQRYKYNGVTGSIEVTVLNQLVATNTVSEAIDVIVEVSGGKDLTFACPSAISYSPYAGTISQQVTQKEEEEHQKEYNVIQKRELSPLDREPAPYGSVHVDRIETQMMGESVAISRNDAQQGARPETISKQDIVSNMSPEAFCIGEKISSIRQLIKRFGNFGTVAFTWTSQTAVISPFSFRRYNDENNTIFVPNTYLDYYSAIYGFWRGSKRFKITYYDQINNKNICGAGTSRIVMVNSLQDDMVKILSGTSQDKRLTSAAISTYIPGASTLQVNTNLEGMAEFEVPYYNTSHICPITLEKDTTSDDMLKGHIPTSMVIARYAPQVECDTASLDVYHAAGDDYSFMYLLGVPPLKNRTR